MARSCKRIAMKRQELPAVPLTSQALLDNLRDAGCDLELAKQVLALEQAGQYQEQMRLLSAHRRQLLDCLHREERQIDCLDYLVYQLEKRRSGGAEAPGTADTKI